MKTIIYMMIAVCAMANFASCTPEELDEKVKVQDESLLDDLDLTEGEDGEIGGDDDEGGA